MEFNIDNSIYVGKENKNVPLSRFKRTTQWSSSNQAVTPFDFMPFTTASLQYWSMARAFYQMKILSKCGYVMHYP